MPDNKSHTERFFWAITSRPRTAIVAALTVLVAMTSGLSGIVKDTSVKAFIPAGHPSLLAEEKATDVFGLSDSVAVALTSLDEATIFVPETLVLVAEISDRVGRLPNVRSDRVMSIATESSIRGEDSSVFVEPYVVANPTLADAADSYRRWRQMPPHQGSLVSDDARSAIIVAELMDADAADETYEAILAIADTFAASLSEAGLEMHVAGPGAVSGYLSRYIDRDARKLQPLVFVLVLGFVYFAFRRASALPGPLFVVLGAAGGALGIMAWNGVPYYAITNALPVIVVAISVADAIHILSAYYQYHARDRDAAPRNHVVAAMTDMARPITLTTLTTVAGFVGIAAVSIMPPITAFAWYAALGVVLAWVFSLLVLPNVLVIVRPGPSPAFESWAHNRPSGMGRFLAHMGSFSATHYKLVLALFAVAILVAATGAQKLRIDRSQVDNFAPGEAIRMADEHINSTFAGTAFLDVIIEAEAEEGLLDAQRMQEIARLQSFFEQQPHVQKTVAITDYLSLLHQAMENRQVSASRSLPDTDDAVAQYLLVYEASGDPADLEEEIDYVYQTALVRGALNEHHFSETSKVVEAMQQFIREEFNEDGLTATLAGDVNVSYHWMSSLKQSHFRGVALSLFLVLLTSVLVFRSLGAGLVSIVPVSFAVLTLYACMGYMGIYLEPATSMFAAIALGVGVDFAIHLVDRLRKALAEHDEDIHAAVEHALPPTARACFFNSAALAIGFSVLLVSDLPTLQRFGGLVAVASVSSFVAALVIVPALFAAGRALHSSAFVPARTSSVRAGMVVAACILAALAASPVEAESMDGLELATKVADRQERSTTHRSIEMTLTDRRGRSRQRSAIILRQATAESRQTRITYVAPKSVRDVTFLSHSPRNAAGSGDRWLYLPAARKVRRIPASDRGDYFLGTDFSYEDMQSELKFDLADYNFQYGGQQTQDGRLQYRLSGEPKNTKLARQLGYGMFDALIDAESYLPIQIEFFDPDLAPLKTIVVSDFETADNVWTATDISAANHQTGHKTRFVFRDLGRADTLVPALFQSSALSRGLPAALRD